MAVGGIGGTWVSVGLVSDCRCGSWVSVDFEWVVIRNPSRLLALAPMSLEAMLLGLE